MTIQIERRIEIKLEGQEAVNRFPKISEQFTLTTDASNQGLGAVISQNNDPCLFIPRTFNKGEEKYATLEKELLEIVWQ